MSEERGERAVRTSTPGTWPGGTQAAEPPSARSGCGSPTGGADPGGCGERGPYVMVRVPSVQASCVSAAPRGLPGRSAASPPERHLHPAPNLDNVLDKSRFLAFGRNCRVGNKHPANLDPLTSREAPGSGEGRSAEKGHAGGLAEPPRLFREKCQQAPPLLCKQFSEKAGRH